MERKPVVVSPGQVWADKDKRQAGRRVRVISADQAGSVHYVNVHNDRLRNSSRYGVFVERFRLAAEETIQGDVT